MFTTLAGERWLCATTLRNMLHAKLRKVSSKSSRAFTITLTGFTARQWEVIGGGMGRSHHRWSLSSPVVCHLRPTTMTEVFGDASRSPQHARAKWSPCSISQRDLPPWTGIVVAASSMESNGKSCSLRLAQVTSREMAGGGGSVCGSVCLPLSAAQGACRLAPSKWVKPGIQLFPNCGRVREHGGRELRGSL